MSIPCLRKHVLERGVADVALLVDDALERSLGSTSIQSSATSADSSFRRFARAATQRRPT